MGVELGVVDPNPNGIGSGGTVEITAGGGIAGHGSGGASGGVSRGSIEWIQARLVECLAHLKCAGEVRVRLVGDEEMSHAHHRHCGVTGTTDVITFDLAEGAAAKTRELDVDILVCVDEARRQAGQSKGSVDRELLLYALHGVLHCLGHDDHDEEAYEKMHRAEDEVLQAIGVGAVFRKPNDPNE